jgi:hypothetical protein
MANFAYNLANLPDFAQAFGCCPGSKSTQEPPIRARGDLREHRVMLAKTPPVDDLYAEKECRRLIANYVTPISELLTVVIIDYAALPLGRNRDN